MDNQDFIPFSSEPSENFNNRGRWSNRRNTRRGYRGNLQQNNAFRQEYSPYNRQFTPRNFNQGPRGCYDKNDISSYYHPSMMDDPWAELEKRVKRNKSPAYEANSSVINNIEDENKSSDSVPSKPALDSSSTQEGFSNVR